MTAADRSEWVVRPRGSPGAMLRLFCLPYAGGGASLFRPWADRLAPAVEVYGVQLPGRERRIRERPIDRLVELAPLVADALLPYLDRPYAFFGHSMGALIAFEVARRLREHEAPVPSLLIASGHAAPQLVSPRPKIHALPDAEFIEELRRYRGTPEAVLADRDILALYLPLLRADFALFETYEHRPAEPLACPIVAYGGRYDTEVLLADLDAWRAQTRASFRLRTFEGDHFYIHGAQGALLDALAEDLSQSAA